MEREIKVKQLYVKKKKKVNNSEDKQAILKLYLVLLFSFPLNDGARSFSRGRGKGATHRRGVEDRRNGTKF